VGGGTPLRPQGRGRGLVSFWPGGRCRYSGRQGRGEGDVGGGPRTRGYSRRHSETEPRPSCRPATRGVFLGDTGAESAGLLGGWLFWVSLFGFLLPASTGREQGTWCCRAGAPSLLLRLCRPCRRFGTSRALRRSQIAATERKLVSGANTTRVGRTTGRDWLGETPFRRYLPEAGRTTCAHVERSFGGGVP